MAERQLIERIDEHLTEIRDDNARANELMEEMRQEVRLSREEHGRNQARFNSSRSVMREMVLDLREGRAMLADIRHGIQANTEGLLRVVDDLRREHGPSAAGA